MSQPTQPENRFIAPSTGTALLAAVDPDPVPAAGVAGISDMARSLAATLEAAPARESRRGAALRQYLTSAARELAALADRPNADDSFDAASARLLVEQIRHIATDLATAPPAAPIGIGVALQAFAAQLLPDAMLVLRPTGRFDYPFREELYLFRSLAERLRLTTLAAGPDVPREALVLRYPQGEQDNVLLSCNLLRAFQPHNADQPLQRSDVFAAWLLGPAYFFACATELERTGPPHSADALAQLRHVSALLQAAGWFEHPQIGPLLRQWTERFGLRLESNMEANTEVGSTPALAQEQAALWTQAGAPQYLPADFDRDAPRLWDRLRQLLPPNDLELESVESAQPADAVSILNAGWSFALLHMDDLYRILGSHTAEDRYEASQVLNRLLTKGIELSHIARLWRQARD
jgi:hypothetical protein